jgi:hypothetical protein
MEKLFKEFKGKANFAVIAISEAHASDEWPVGEIVSFCRQPRSLEERVELYQNFVKDNNFILPLYVDTMENTFMKTFSAWPFRFYILQGNKLVFKAQPHKITHNYNLNEVEDFLTSHVM